MASVPLLEGPQTPDELRCIRLFKDMDEAHLARILPLLERRFLRARASLAMEQEFSGQVCLVWSGRCRVTANAPNGACITLSAVGAGEAFSCALAVLSLNPGATTRVTADEPTLILLLPGPDLLDLAHQSPALGRALMVKLAKLAVHYTGRAFELAALDVRGRLVAELLRLAEGASWEGGVRVLRRAPTQSILAAQICATREAVTRHMRELAEEGVIRFHRGVIEFIDIDRLRAQDQLAANRILYRTAGS